MTKLIAAFVLIATSLFAATPDGIANAEDVSYEYEAVDGTFQSATGVGDTVTGTGSQEIIADLSIGSAKRRGAQYILVIDSINGGTGSAVPDSIDLEILVDVFRTNGDTDAMYQVAVDTIESAGGGVFFLDVGNSVIGQQINITLQGTGDNDTGPGSVVITRFEIWLRRTIEINQSHN